MSNRDKSPIFIDGDFNDHYPTKRRRGGRRLPFLPEPCPQHKMKNKLMGYCEHHDWMAAQNRKGLRQEQCTTCGYYLFPEEV